jgi:hypothetical protein
MSTSSRLRSLDIDNINPHVKAAKYAVRGALAQLAEKYRSQLAQGEGGDLPFDRVISANIGNPQQLDQKPITFFRQVLSLVEYPALLDNERVLLDQMGYERDAVARARWLLDQVGSVGAYSSSAGVPAIRESVAKFIERMCGKLAEIFANINRTRWLPIRPPFRISLRWRLVRGQYPASHHLLFSQDRRNGSHPAVSSLYRHSRRSGRKVCALLP